MNPQIRNFARKALWTLPLWTALLFLGTLTHQPDPQTAFPAFAAYITTDVFLLSHLVASIAGAAIGSIGVVGLLLYLQETKGAGKSITATVVTVVSNIFLTSVFGVAAFAQPAMGRMFLAGEQSAVDFYNQVYTAPLMATAMLALLLFLIGGAFMGSAIAASGLLPRWTGWAYALGMVGYVVSFIILPVGMSVFSALLIITTIAIARSATREPRPQVAEIAIAPGA